MEREEAALVSSWEQWERGALQTRASLETTLSQIASSEQEFSSLSSQLEHNLHEFSRQLQEWRRQLAQAEGKTDGEEAVKGWQSAKVHLKLACYSCKLYIVNILMPRIRVLFLLSSGHFGGTG